MAVAEAAVDIRRRTTVLPAVEDVRVASSPIVVGSGEAIVGGQWTIAS